MVLLYIRGQQHQEFRWFGGDKTVMGSSFLSSPSRLSLSRIHSLPAAAPIPFHQGLDPSSSLVAQLVNNLPVLKEIPVQFLGREEPLEKADTERSCLSGHDRFHYLKLRIKGELLGERAEVAFLKYQFIRYSN